MLNFVIVTMLNNNGIMVAMTNIPVISTSTRKKIITVEVIAPEWSEYIDY